MYLARYNTCKRSTRRRSTSMTALFVGIDTGGTFTDLVLLQEGEIRVHKVLSTPDDPSRAILQGLADLGVAVPDDPTQATLQNSTNLGAAVGARVAGRGGEGLYGTL